jgi:catechol 2,3-dioxygenase-like lactoylglutathione lyase family enzyme
MGGSIMEPKLGPLRQVACSCRDLRTSIGWYRDALGLQLIAEFSPPGIAFFRLGGTRLMLDAAPDAGRNSVLYFEVDDVVAAQRALEARGVKFKGQPQRIHRDDTGTFGPAGNEEWMTFFQDPDGNLLALAEQRLPAEG